MKIKNDYSIVFYAILCMNYQYTFYAILGMKKHELFFAKDS